MEVLTHEPVIYKTLDNLDPDEIDRYCRSSRALWEICQSPAYWQHRIARDFNIPSEATDTRQTYYWTRRFRDPKSQPDRCFTNLPYRFAHQLIERIINEGLQNLTHQAFFITGKLNRSDLIDRLTWRFGNRDLYYAFIGAAEGGHRDLVINMIKLGVFEEKVISKALNHAAAGGHTDLVIELINDWHAQGYDDALVSAAGHGRLEVMGELIRRGASDFKRALGAAAYAGQRDATIYLVDRSVTSGVFDIENIKNAIEMASKGGKLDTLIVLLDYGKNKWDYEFPICVKLDEALYEAAGWGHLDVVNMLLNFIMRRDIINKALEKAVMGGCVNVIKTLISKGADAFDKVFMEAVLGDKWDAVIELAKYKIPKSDIKTAIEIANDRGHSDIANTIKRMRYM